jgi:hypothetical protein
MSSQTWTDTDSFLQINSISINFNNQSGILASATAYDLYRYSKDGGSNQSWAEFRGQAFRNSLAGGNYSDSVPNGYRIWTSGSLLVLDFGSAIQLTESFYAAGSLGNFNLQFTLNVTNNSDDTISPEICLITMNSGLFVNERGQSSVFTGILTKADVLEASQMMPYSRADARRMVGGGFLDGLKSVLGQIGEVALPVVKNIGQAALEKGAKSLLGLGVSGGAVSGGAVSGGAVSGGAVSGGRMKKHLM